MRIEAGRFRGRLLPQVREARPVPGRLRGSLFNVLREWVPGARVLDLFAGVGGLGLEALSRGAEDVTLVDRDAAAVRALGRWIEEAGAAAEARVLCSDVLRRPLPDGPFDLVFVDPPFELWGREDLPGLLARAAERLTPDGRLALKLPARLELPPDPRWTFVRRRAMGSVAWALLARPAVGPGAAGAEPATPGFGPGFPSRAEPAAPMEGGSVPQGLDSDPPAF